MSEHTISLAATATVTTRQSPPPLTLYIHLPWCGSKCPYCDFNSHTAPRQLPERDYINALIADLNATLPQVWGRPLSAIFIGGGTPSLFSVAAIEQLLTHLRALFNFPPDIEITLEANPDSSDIRRFTGYRAAGINRLSLGVQSFNDTFLKPLRRLHDSAAAKRAAAAAAESFENFNIDLMHALPGQESAAARADVRTAAAYAPTHLSLYQLTLEEGTPFFRQPPPQLPDSDSAADIADAVEEEAGQQGYARYEISAFAASDRHRCRHNLNYWQFGDYLGIGAGAHSKITTAGTVIREQRIKHPGEYMRRAGSADAVSRRQQPGRDDIIFEFMLNALRLTEGFSTALLTAHTGGGTPLLRRALAEAVNQALITHSPTRIRPTARGQRYLNTLTTLFLPQSDADYSARA